jgi:hypothetical protein
MNPPNQKSIDTASSTSADLYQPASWPETLLALGPFLVWPALLLFRNFMTVPNLSMVILFLILSLLLVALLVGWVKGFPRWCFPYWGFVFLVALYFQGFRGTVFGKSFSGNWLVWLPVLGVALIGTLWTRDLRVIYRLFRSLWLDWTRISFVIYGLLPLVLIAIYDEVHDTISQPALIGLMLLLALGALLYMRSANLRSRFLWLVAGFSLCWLLATLHLVLYWNGRQEPGMRAPATWDGTLSWAAPIGLFLLIILIAPALLAGLRWLAGVKRPSLQP